MEIKLDKLKLRNFKGIKDLEIDFNCRNTNIYGANATGKTTIFDAFKWLFFNKDSNNRTDFSIKELDKDSKPIHFLEHEVEAILIIDGTAMKFKRVFLENWVKRRGEEKKEFSSNTSNYWINDVPVQEKEYKQTIKQLIDEETFKLITDPLHFNKFLDEKRKKEILFSIVGTEYRNEDIINSDSKFIDLKEHLKGKSVEDYSKILKEQIKLLEKEIDEIPGSIDTLNDLLITNNSIDYSKLEEEKESYIKQLEIIENEMTSIQARAKENMKIADELAIANNELNNLKFKLEVEYSNKYSAEIMKLNNEKSITENQIRNNDKTISEIEIYIQQDQKRKDELYKKWDEVNKLKLEFNPEEFICPMCKREYETEKKEELQKEFENNFSQDKKNRLDDINKEGQEINKKLESNKAIRDTKQNENLDLNNKLKEISLKIAETEKQQEETSKFDINSVPEYIEKQKEVNKLQEELSKVTQSDTTEIQERRKEIQEKLDIINKELSRKDVEKEIREKIENLENKETENAKKIQELQYQQFLIEELEKTKIEMNESAINSNFRLVKFKLLQEQQNGAIKQVCETTINGVPYNDLNNAHKILAGLDIINTLMKFYDKKAPIFIDNRESINELYNIDTQIISLIVTTDSQLRIEVI